VLCWGIACSVCSVLYGLGKEVGEFLALGLLFVLERKILCIFLLEEIYVGINGLYIPSGKRHIDSKKKI